MLRDVIDLVLKAVENDILIFEKANVMILLLDFILFYWGIGD